MLTIEMSTTRFLLRKYDIIEQINSRDLAVGDIRLSTHTQYENDLRVQSASDLCNKFL